MVRGTGNVETGFVAVRTKRLVPAPRQGSVPRPDLTGLLDDGRDGRLTVVSAPTGSGKTTALAEWAAQTPARVAWYTLDKGDNDPLRFWTYVVAAIGDAAPELPGTAARRLRAPGVSLADEVLPVLVNEVAGVREPLAIVLDDYHEVAEPAIHQDLGYLLSLKALGVPAVTTVGAALVLLKRGKDIFWILAGFALLGLGRRARAPLLGAAA